MALEKIISVSGKPGLFKIISQTSYGLIAESLEDGKRLPVYSHYRISSLGDISMYTYSDDAPLSEILWSIHEKHGKNELDLKLNDAQVREWFETILPEFDKERVYTSDIKKLMKWYNLMLKNDLIENPAEATEETEAAPAEEAGASEDKKSAPKARKSTKKAETETDDDKPKARKTTTKKAAEDKSKSPAAPKSKSAGKAAASSKAKGSGKVSTPRKAS